MDQNPRPNLNIFDDDDNLFNNIQSNNNNTYNDIFKEIHGNRFKKKIVFRQNWDKHKTKLINYPNYRRRPILSRLQKLNPNSCVEGLQNVYNNINDNKFRSCKYCRDNDIQIRLPNAQNLNSFINIVRLAPRNPTLQTWFNYDSHKAYPNQEEKHKIKCYSSLYNYVRNTRACGGVPYNKTLPTTNNQRLNKIKSEAVHNFWKDKQRISLLKNNINQLTYELDNPKLKKYIHAVSNYNPTLTNDIKKTIQKWKQFYGSIKDVRGIMSHEINQLLRNAPQN